MVVSIRELGAAVSHFRSSKPVCRKHFFVGTFSCDDGCVEYRRSSDVLIVEDDPIIALDFEDTIIGFGVKTVRTAASVARALELIDQRAPDFALLDIGLMREKSFAIAERLDALQIPFAFVTGYGADVELPAAFSTRPRLPKPCAADALQAVLNCKPY